MTSSPPKSQQNLSVDLHAKHAELVEKFPPFLLSEFLWCTFRHSMRCLCRAYETRFLCKVRAITEYLRITACVFTDKSMLYKVHFIDVTAYSCSLSRVELISVQGFFRIFCPHRFPQKAALFFKRYVSYTFQTSKCKSNSTICSLKCS